MTARVLVTGAAGRIGRAVCADLRRHDIAVTALVREADLADGEPPAADPIVTGDAGDPDAVARALSTVDAVVHLAAIPWPKPDAAVEVFTGNTRATFVVLEQAGLAGIRRAVIASSYSVLGLYWASRPVHPVYYPLDEAHPVLADDPYGLSKQVDEATAEMMWRRHRLSVLALRFPRTSRAEQLDRAAAQAVEDPAAEAGNSWAYLDLRDAATACRLALSAPVEGSHAMFLAAPETLAPYPTEDLIAAYHPGTELRRPIPGRGVPIDTGRASRLLDFTPRHVLSVPERPFVPR